MKSEKKLKVLIVEDSLTAQKMLVSILERDAEIEVVGVASDGKEALTLLGTLDPDVITMDIHMPGMNGLDVTRQIMETRPIPIIVVSASCLVHDVGRAFKLIEAGALTAVPKPLTSTSCDFAAMSKRLVQTVKDMAGVKVVRRWPKAKPKGKTVGTAQFGHIDVVGIGASTGGPTVIHQILKDLPQDFPIPIIVVQHIAPGFGPGMVDWLSKTLKLKIKLAEQDEVIKAGVVYLGQDDKHLSVAKNGRLTLSSEEPDFGHRPSVGRLFRSLADNYQARAAGIILTGMGKDGAAELLAMKEKGALTIAQDKESSVVHGMPGEAIKLGAPRMVLSPEAISEVFKQLTK